MLRKLMLFAGCAMLLASMFGCTASITAGDPAAGYYYSYEAYPEGTYYYTPMRTTHYYIWRTGR